MVFPAYWGIIQSDNTTVANPISSKSISLSLQMHPVDTTSCTTLSLSGQECKQHINLKDLWHLPTTQKGVVNAIVLSGLYKYPDGYWELYMDNHYTALELSVMLKAKYKIVACRTICSNHKSWDQS